MELLGDIHGNFSHLEYRIKHGASKNIIQVGDFGLGFRREEMDIQTMDRINKTLVENNKHLYAIRGNHDNPKFWEGSYNKWSNITLVKDGNIIPIEGHKVLFMGGAVSIDREVRKAGVDYWLAECFDYDEDQLAEDLKACGGVDIVVTHTAPSFCYPRVFNSLVHRYAAEDPTLLEELTLERSLVDRAYQVICEHSKPKTWVYGHFHNDISEEIDGIKFILLGIGSDINL